MSSTKNKKRPVTGDLPPWARPSTRRFFIIRRLQKPKDRRKKTKARDRYSRASRSEVPAVLFIGPMARERVFHRKLFSQLSAERPCFRRFHFRKRRRIPDRRTGTLQRIVRDFFLLGKKNAPFSERFSAIYFIFSSPLMSRLGSQSPNVGHSPSLQVNSARRRARGMKVRISSLL